MIGRLLRSEDFARVLQSRGQVRSDHFALHHLSETPGRPGVRLLKLSTEKAPPLNAPVDEFACLASAADDKAALAVLPPGRGSIWFGAVVPKRHARRAVTRSLLKRQIRSRVGAHAANLVGGMWVVRLRAAFDRAAYPSAASTALKDAVRRELDVVLTRAAAVRRPAG